MYSVFSVSVTAAEVPVFVPLSALVLTAQEENVNSDSRRQISFFIVFAPLFINLPFII